MIVTEEDVEKVREGLHKLYLWTKSRCVEKMMRYECKKCGSKFRGVKEFDCPVCKSKNIKIIEIMPEVKRCS